MFHKNCLKFGTLNLKKVKVNGFKFIQEHSKHGSFRKKKTIILSRYMSCSWARFMFAEYIRLIVSRLGLLSEYDYWLAEYSPIITTNGHCPLDSDIAHHFDILIQVCRELNQRQFLWPAWFTMNGYFSILQNGLNGYWEKISAHQDPPRGKVGRTFHCEPEPFSWYCQKAKISKKIMKFYNNMINIPFALSPTKMCYKKVCKKNTNVLFLWCWKSWKIPIRKKLRGKWLLGGWLPLPSLTSYLPIPVASLITFSI